MPKKRTVRKSRLPIWLSHYINQDNPITFLNNTESARAAGYQTESDQTLGEIGSQNCKKLKSEIAKWWDDVGFSDNALKKKLHGLMNAKKIKFFAHQGEIIDREEVEALEIQRSSLDMAFKVKGLYKKDNEQGGGVIVLKPPAINKPANSGTRGLESE